MLSGYFGSIPVSLFEAAKIDGAGEFTIFHRIVLTLLRPAFGALVPMLAIGTWNDFFVPLVFLTRDETKTIPIGLMKFYAGQFIDISKLNLVFTATTLSIAPILITYLISSESIVKGITAGSVKQ